MWMQTAFQMFALSFERGVVMTDLSAEIEEIIEKKIRPRTRVDGGDVKFEKLENGTVYIGAYADCSVCPCCEPELSLWVKREVNKLLGIDIHVKVNNHVPYFYK